ncbi:sodium:calcium antiporter [Flammeovirga aprica]|uniref:Sodium:calcium antiporter n=1 Tax=Flammeovirga aprica JL-4 TaxID=694437 RepID=A0A7X9RY15_9BACT|nr:sodium:calcium antiporter [Flammeovirga aprica]NME70821.1 sodium:calcium antiporter [Flammeovirga aprica JL-4]
MEFILLHLIISSFGVILMRNGALMLSKGATALSTKSHFSGLRVGLTIVALGTSIPEVAVSLISTFKNEETLAFGTLIGSNTFNVIFGLGLTTFFVNIRVFAKSIWRDLLVAIFGGILLFILLNKQLIFNIGANYLTRTDSLILLFCFFIYYLIIFTNKKSRREISLLKAQKHSSFHNSNKQTIIRNIIIGILIICVGAYIVVIEALLLSSTTTLTSRFIGVSIMSICTSLPEITTTLAAMRRKRHDIALGNIMGSYIINFLLTPCLLTIKGEAFYDYTLNYDLIFSILICILCVTLVLSSKYYILNRLTSILLISLGILYYITTYLRG